VPPGSVVDVVVVVDVDGGTTPRLGIRPACVENQSLAPPSDTDGVRVR
jgi:hypothetical protein